MGTPLEISVPKRPRKACYGDLPHQDAENRQLEVSGRARTALRRSCTLQSEDAAHDSTRINRPK